MTKPIFKARKAPKAYKLDPEKLKGASQSILPYLFGSNLHYTEDYEYFDKIKYYLDIPEPRKSIDEISQELDEKIDAQVEKFKMCSQWARENTEKRYKQKFDRIIENFEYAKEHGQFPQKLKWVMGTGWSVNSSSYVETSMVIKQGDNHKGYYTIGNQRYLRYYMNEKPNVIVRFFMKTCLGFFWVDDENAK